MATWHQLRVQTRLYHDTQWTVVEDPPNECRVLALCETEAEANAYRDQSKAQHPTWSVYVLKPANYKPRIWGEPR